MYGYDERKEKESRIGESCLLHKFLGLISVHMLASLKLVWKEKAASFSSKGFKRKCVGAVRKGLKAREHPSLRLESSLTGPTILAGTRGMSALQLVALIYPLEYRILSVWSLIYGLLQIGCHLLHLCSEPGRLWSEEDNVIGAAGALAQHWADENTSCSHLTRLNWVRKGLCRSTTPCNKASVLLLSHPNKCD